MIQLIRGEVTRLGERVVRMSEAVAGTIELDSHAQLRAEVAGALVQIGRGADNHVRTCQVAIWTYVSP